MTSPFRPLTSSEINQLECQNCTCTDWTKILVVSNFKTDTIHHVQFSGKIKLGSFKKKITFFGGVTKNAGIYYSAIHNCEIGNNVYINNVKNYIANYIIEDDVIIDNVDPTMTICDINTTTFAFSVIIVNNIISDLSISCTTWYKADFYSTPTVSGIIVDDCVALDGHASILDHDATTRRRVAVLDCETVESGTLSSRYYCP